MFFITSIYKMADFITKTVKKMGGWRVVIGVIVAACFLWSYSTGKSIFPIDTFSGNVRFSPTELGGGGGGGGFGGGPRRTVAEGFE